MSLEYFLSPFSQIYQTVDSLGEWFFSVSTFTLCFINIAEKFTAELDTMDSMAQRNAGFLPSQAQRKSLFPYVGVGDDKLITPTPMHPSG